MTKRGQITRDCEWCDERISLPTDNRRAGKIRYCCAGCHLMARVKRSGECWEFHGAKTRGYGRIGIRTANGVIQARASRASYLTFVGELIGEKDQVCHTCDNPSCINPRHLFAGSRFDNQQDSVAKGRNYRGSRTWKSILTEDQVVDIKAAIRAGRRNCEIAKERNLRPEVVSRIRCNKYWKHVA